MSIRLLGTIVVSWAVALGAITCPVMAQEAEPAAGATPSGQAAAEEATSAEPAAQQAAETPYLDMGEVAISAAEEHLRQGVSLYNRGLFSEALGEFNRALALDSKLEEARKYREKCNAKLQLSAAGADPTAIATFETFDPESVRAEIETPELSAEEIKVQRVRTLMKDAEAYLEYQRYSTAQWIFEEILLIDPDNERAKEGLHKATLGVHRKAIEAAQKGITEDRAETRRYIEESKLLPEGAGPTGIKEFRITVPTIEEEYEPPEEKSLIEQTLDSPVSIEFEDIHINEIVEFLSDSWDVNIVVDDRVVPRPSRARGAVAPGPGAPGGAPGAYPGARGGAYPGAAGAPMEARAAGTETRSAFGTLGTYGYTTDGIVPYINLKNVALRDALKALLRPLNLDFAVQPGFIWISTPDKIRLETFEDLETRYYELRNAGAETLFKIVIRNVGGGGGGGYGGQRGGYGGQRGGYGGGGGGGYGGGGYGGQRGGYGGGGYGGGGYGGGGYGGQRGGYGGQRGGYGGRGGGYGGGGYGGGMVAQFSNISDLFGSINDQQVGETPAIIGLSTSGTGVTAGQRTTTATTYGAQADLYGQADTTTTAGALGAGGEAVIVTLLRDLIPEVREPYTNELLSRMIYNPLTNQLIVKNTPTNLAKLEAQLAELDVMPKQVSIEAKFLTVTVKDLDKVGFNWNLTMSDQNDRPQQLSTLEETTYEYDINGDGVMEQIPFYRRPDGSSVIANRIASGVLDAAMSSVSQGDFSLEGVIMDNQDGDTLKVTFDYLNSLDESELLSAPRVTTMNRKPAVIAQFETEYYVTSVETQMITSEAGFGGSGSIGYSQNPIPQAFNFGYSLSVTPQISGGDQVRLWLNPQVTSRGTNTTFTQKSIIAGDSIETTVTLPGSKTQAVWTNVIVHDGDTLVLGGLVTDTTIKGTKKMPYVADLPVIGFLFRGKERTVQQTSLLIFVTPDIVDTTGARFFQMGM